MAREDMLIDEGATFGRRRRSTPTTPATAAEVQAALDAAATELDVNATDAQFQTTELFSPVGGGEPVAGASAADADMFMREGYTPGTLPPEYRTLFGNDPDVIGYKVTTNPDGSQSVTVAKAQGDADGGLQFQTYGAKIKTDASGKVTPFTATPIAGASGIAGSGTGLKTAEQIAADAKTAEDKAKRQSAYDLLYEEFDRYGLSSLVTPLKDLITSGVSPSEFTLRLRETDAYKKRFSANQARIKNGLRALSEFEYITKEDAYQEVMRRRGLPPEYYAKGDLGVQKGFDALISGDVSSTELEDRIVTAQDRVLNANPEIAKTLKEFYPGISNGDILAYALDPVNAINSIKRKITAAEIGVAAKAEGLTSGLSRAEELAMMGITGEAAKQGYQTIAGVVPRASQLSEIYKQSPYTQQTAETEVFGLSGATEAAKQRKKLTSLETAAFSGSAGAGAIARDRAGAL